MLQHAEKKPHPLNHQTMGLLLITYFIFQFMQPDFRTWCRTYFQLQVELHICCIPAESAAVAVQAAAAVLAGSGTVPAAVAALAGSGTVPAAVAALAVPGTVPAVVVHFHTCSAVAFPDIHSSFSV